MHPYLAQARTQGTPLIDGSTVILLWQGARPPRLWADFNLSGEALELEQIDHDLWASTVQLPRDGYFEYFFEETGSGRRLPDPHNPRRVSNGLGQLNHYFYMPEAHPTPLTRLDPGVPRGDLSHFQLDTHGLLVGETR